MISPERYPPPRLGLFLEKKIMNLNVFTWIREGVRQSVLMGVSDALEHIGAAPDGDDLKARVATAITRRESELAAAGAIPQNANRPKRLGRSLKDIDIDGDR